jgi:hypothetical protein
VAIALASTRSAEPRVDLCAVLMVPMVPASD